MPVSLTGCLALLAVATLAGQAGAATGHAPVASPAISPRPMLAATPLAGTATGPAGAGAATTVPTATDAPPWLEIVHAPPGTSAGEAWILVRREQMEVAPGDAVGPIQQRAIEDSLRFPGRLHQVHRDSGPHAGDWQFVGNEGDRLPRSASRTLPLGLSPYRLRIELYCDAQGPDCDALRDQFRYLRAPAPITQPALWPEWEAIVASEPCEMGPRHTPAPRYPASEDRPGQVGLKLLVNRCGEVRHVAVQQSSGVRVLDRAAVHAARAWRTAPPPDGVTTAWMQVTLKFAFADE